MQRLGTSPFAHHLIGKLRTCVGDHLMDVPRESPASYSTMRSSERF